jgi:hypothetical protein
VARLESRHREAHLPFAVAATAEVSVEVLDQDERARGGVDDAILSRPPGMT